MPRLLLTEEDQNQIWDIERWEIGSGSVNASRLTQVPFRELRDRFMSVCHRWREHIDRQYVHQPRSSWPPKANHFELSRPARRFQLGRSRGVTRAFDRPVNIVQFSVMGSGIKRSHVSLQSPDYRTALELPRDLAALRSQRCNRSTGSNFASFICNWRGCCLIERRYNRSQFKRVKFQRN